MGICGSSPSSAVDTKAAGNREKKTPSGGKKKKAKPKRREMPSSAEAQQQLSEGQEQSSRKPSQYSNPLAAEPECEFTDLPIVLQTDRHPLTAPNVLDNSGGNRNNINNNTSNSSSGKRESTNNERSLSKGKAVGSGGCSGGEDRSRLSSVVTTSGDESKRVGSRASASMSDPTMWLSEGEKGVAETPTLLIVVDMAKAISTSLAASGRSPGRNPLMGRKNVNQRLKDRDKGHFRIIVTPSRDDDQYYVPLATAEELLKADAVTFCSEFDERDIAQAREGPLMDSGRPQKVPRRKSIVHFFQKTYMYNPPEGDIQKHDSRIWTPRKSVTSTAGLLPQHSTQQQHSLLSDYEGLQFDSDGKIASLKKNRSGLSFDDVAVAELEKAVAEESKTTEDEAARGETAFKSTVPQEAYENNLLPFLLEEGGSKIFRWEAPGKSRWLAINPTIPVATITTFSQMLCVGAILLRLSHVVEPHHNTTTTPTAEVKRPQKEAEQLFLRAVAQLQDASTALVRKVAPEILLRAARRGQQLIISGSKFGDDSTKEAMKRMLPQLEKNFSSFTKFEEACAARLFEMSTERSCGVSGVDEVLPGLFIAAEYLANPKVLAVKNISAILKCCAQQQQQQGEEHRIEGKESDAGALLRFEKMVNGSTVVLEVGVSTSESFAMQRLFNRASQFLFDCYITQARHVIITFSPETAGIAPLLLIAFFSVTFGLTVDLAAAVVRESCSSTIGLVDDWGLYQLARRFAHLSDDDEEQLNDTVTSCDGECRKEE